MRRSQRGLVTNQPQILNTVTKKKGILLIFFTGINLVSYIISLRIRPTTELLRLEWFNLTRMGNALFGQLVPMAIIGSFPWRSRNADPWRVSADFHDDHRLVAIAAIG